jgi:hypothetical protein
MYDDDGESGINGAASPEWWNANGIQQYVVVDYTVLARNLHPCAPIHFGCWVASTAFISNVYRICFFNQLQLFILLKN